MDGDRQLLRRTEPPRDLAPLVEAFAGRQARVRRAAFPVFPTARAELIFHFGDPFLVNAGEGETLRPLPPSALLGPRSRICWQSAGPRIDWFMIQLTALGCRRLLGLSFAEAWHDEIALADLWGAQAEALHEKLRAAGTFESRVAVATEMLRPRIGAEGDRLSHLGAVARAGRIRSVSALVDGLGVGPRRLHQRFVADYGISPKGFLNLMRFGRQLTARHPLAAPDMDEPEYADDSHAIREFRRFSGLTPGAYARAKQDDRLIFTGAPILLD